MCIQFHLSQHLYDKAIDHVLKTVVYYANISLLANVSIMPLKIASHLADCLGSKLYPFSVACSAVL